MGENNNNTNKSRSWFLIGGILEKVNKKEMIKMLMVDCKLVEIDKAMLEAASKKQKSSNKEIYGWMKNPSKENNS